MGGTLQLESSLGSGIAIFFTLAARLWCGAERSRCPATPQRCIRHWPPAIPSAPWSSTTCRKIARCWVRCSRTSRLRGPLSLFGRRRPANDRTGDSGHYFSRRADAGNGYGGGNGPPSPAATWIKFAVRLVATHPPSAFTHEQEGYRAAGFEDIVSKPIPCERVYDCLAALLGVKFDYVAETESRRWPRCRCCLSMTAWWQVCASRRGGRRRIVQRDRIAAVHRGDRATGPAVGTTGAAFAPLRAGI